MVFDPLYGTNEFLELSICDACLVAGADRVLLIEHGTRPPPVLKREIWTPPNGDF
jgi:hypothetical protein